MAQSSQSLINAMLSPPTHSSKRKTTKSTLSSFHSSKPRIMPQSSQSSINAMRSPATHGNKKKTTNQSLINAMLSPATHSNKNKTTKLASPPMLFDTTMYWDTTKPDFTKPARKSAYWEPTPHASLHRSESTAAALKIKLRALGVYYKVTATAKRCEKLLQRFERGLLSYEPLSASDLTTFAKDRGLPCKPEGNEHSQMVKLLEKADEEQKFEKFLDLPCELRLMVYEFHLKGMELPRGRRRVKPPPVCRASALVRSEALPLFAAKETEKKML